MTDSNPARPMTDSQIVDALDAMLRLIARGDAARCAMRIHAEFAF